MPSIPPAMLKQLYVRGSLRIVRGALEMRLRNHLATATIQGLSLTIDGTPIPDEKIEVNLGGTVTRARDLDLGKPVHFLVGSEAVIRIYDFEPQPGSHALEIRPLTKEIGLVTIKTQDDLHLSS